MALGSTSELAIVLKLIDKATPGLKKATNETRSLSQQMGAMGKSLTKNVTLPLVAIGAAGVKMAADLDKSMRDIQSLGGRTDSQIKDLSKTFVRMSTDINVTVDSANNLAKAYYDVASAGYAGEEAMRVLEAATKAGTAGLTDTQTAAGALIGVLKSYGMETSDAAHVSDLFFTTVQRGKTTFGELAAAIPTVLPLTSALGISFEEVTAAATTMSNQSIDMANGMTYLRALVTELTNPSEKLAGIIAEMGYASGRAMIEQLGLNGTLQQLDAYSRRSGVAVDDMFNNVRAGLGALSLTGRQMENFNTHLEAMGEAAGATNAAYAEQIKSVSAQFQNFKNTVNAALISLGELVLPTLLDIMKVVKGIFDAFNSLPEPVQRTIVTFAAFVAAAGPILMIGSKIMTAFGLIKGVVLAVTTANYAMAASWVAALAPILAVVAAGVALGAILYEIGRHLKIGEHIKEFVSRFKSGFENLKGIVRDGWERVKGWIGEGVKKLPEYLIKAFLGIFGNLIKSILKKGISKTLKDGWEVVKKGVKGIINGAKHLLGIGSPSKVFMAMGQNVGESLMSGITSGIGSGFKITAPAVATASAGLGNAALGSAPMSVNGGAIPASNGPRSGAGWNIYIQYALGTPEELERKLSNITARRASQRGVTG